MRRKIIAGIKETDEGWVCNSCGHSLFRMDGEEKEPEGSRLAFYHCVTCMNGAIFRVFPEGEET